MHKLRYIDLEADSLKSPIAIIGLPGIANVGKIAAETLTSVLDAQKIMDFYSPDFPPRVVVQDGIAYIPKSSFYLYRAAPDEPHDIIILTADFQPATNTGVFEYADFVAQEFSNVGVGAVYALAAYEQGYQDYFSFYKENSSLRVYVSASNDALLGRATELDGTVRFNHGAINGANGIVPTWASSRYDMESACFLGETLGMIKLDYRSAKKILELVSSFVGLKADFDILDDAESKVIDFLEWAQLEIAQRELPPDASENPPDRYIG
ncbi:MAG: PAC2 family protein [Candidatus Thorarchaeota archaeon]